MEALNENSGVNCPLGELIIKQEPVEDGNPSAEVTPFQLIQVSVLTYSP